MNANTVYIHADASGTYQGNGGFICLNELARQLHGMGYTVRWFDHADRLRPEQWAWTGYGGQPIARFADVLADSAPIVTTWLYSWLNTIEQRPDLWPRLRYWCSGELLRDEPQYDASRAFVRDHLREIAINNPSLADAYKRLDISPRWFWTNWIALEFGYDRTVRLRGTIGYQPDGNETDIRAALAEHFGEDMLIECTGSHLHVARWMRRCDLFLAWNHLWPLVCGLGESFGLTLYEAMASGCVAVTRAHCGNTHLAGTVVRVETLHDAIRALKEYRADEVYRGNARHAQTTMIAESYRFDDRRRAAIVGYLEGAR